MHRLAREEKLKGKKLRGKRKRKEMAREKVGGGGGGCCLNVHNPNIAMFGVRTLEQLM